MTVPVAALGWCGHAVRKADEQAERVHHGVDLRARHSEAIADRLVHDDHEAVVLHGATHRSQHVDGLRHVMDALEGERGIERSVLLERVAAGEMEVDAIGDACGSAFAVACSTDGSSMSKPST